MTRFAYLSIFFQLNLLVSSNLLAQNCTHLTTVSGATFAGSGEIRTIKNLGDLNNDGVNEIALIKVEETNTSDKQTLSVVSFDSQTQTFNTLYTLPFFNGAQDLSIVTGELNSSEKFIAVSPKFDYINPSGRLNHNFFNNNYQTKILLFRASDGELLHTEILPRTFQSQTFYGGYRFRVFWFLNTPSDAVIYRIGAAIEYLGLDSSGNILLASSQAGITTDDDAYDPFGNYDALVTLGVTKIWSVNPNNYNFTEVENFKPSEVFFNSFPAELKPHEQYFENMEQMGFDNIRAVKLPNPDNSFDFSLLLSSEKAGMQYDNIDFRNVGFTCLFNKRDYTWTSESICDSAGIPESHYGKEIEALGLFSEGNNQLSENEPSQYQLYAVSYPDPGTIEFNNFSIINDNGGVTILGVGKRPEESNDPEDPDRYRTKEFAAIEGDEHSGLGTAISAAGDLNLNGTPDFAAGAADGRYVGIYDAVTGDEIARCSDANSEGFGSGVSVINSQGSNYLLVTDEDGVAGNLSAYSLLNGSNNQPTPTPSPTPESEQILSDLNTKITAAVNTSLSIVNAPTNRTRNRRISKLKKIMTRIVAKISDTEVVAQLYAIGIENYHINRLKNSWNRTKKATGKSLGKKAFTNAKLNTLINRLNAIGIVVNNSI